MEILLLLCAIAFVFFILFKFDKVVENYPFVAPVDPIPEDLKNTGNTGTQEAQEAQET